MKKNIILLITLILLCCGCTAQYTISIDNDLKISESAVMIENHEFFEAYENSSVQRVLGFILEPNLEYLNSNGFIISHILKETEAGVNITNNYDSIAQYKEISEFPKQYASDWEYIENGNQITLKIFGDFSADEQDQRGRYPVESGVINIKLPHVVISHNADLVDEETGTYTWNIEKAGVEKEIYITFDKVIKNDYTIVYIVIGGIIVVAIGAYYFISNTLYKNKKRNEL